jgi:hypothetical protein
MKKLFWGILRIMMVLVVIFLFGIVVMLLWNWLLPVVAGLPEITFLQAIGLLVLSHILFGGLGGIGRMAAGRAMRGAGQGNSFREKWFKMSDEERREFIGKHRPFHSPVFEERGTGEPDPNKNKE